MSYRRMTTQAQVDSYRDRTRKAFAGKGFQIESNSLGLRAECERCHSSATLNPEQFMSAHRCAVQGRVADYREVTVNADGTRNSILYYA